MNKIALFTASVVVFGLLQGCTTPKTAGLDSAT